MAEIEMLRNINGTIRDVKLHIPKEPPNYLGIEFLETEMELMNEKVQNGCEMPLAASPVYLSRVINARVLSTGEDVKHILEMTLDIKVLLRVLALYTSLPEERLRLEQLCSRQGAPDYDACIAGKAATLATMLRAFPSCKPPVAHVLQLLPRLAPRPYSIACSEAPLRVIFTVLPRGLCTEWLRIQLETFCDLAKRLSAVVLEDSTEFDVRVPVYFRKASNFRMPQCHEKPLILIGPGTGIAPFVAFLQQRETEQIKFPNKELGTIWLFFGCRYSSRDFIYRSVLQQFVEKEVLSRLFVSFSREGDETSPKYVQDNVRLHGKEFVTKLIDEGGSVFICGDAKNMAKDVQEAISYVIQREKGLSEGATQNCITELKNSARYVQDVWR